MRFVIALMLLTCHAGCTTLRPIAGDPSDLRQRLASGELLQQGDRVLIVTTDGGSHEFKVASLGAHTIDGKLESIRIDQVASIQKRQVNVGKTVLLVGLTLVGVAAADALVVGLSRAGAAAAGGY